MILPDQFLSPRNFYLNGLLSPHNQRQSHSLTEKMKHFQAILARWDLEPGVVSTWWDRGREAGILSWAQEISARRIWRIMMISWGLMILNSTKSARGATIAREEIILFDWKPTVSNSNWQRESQLTTKLQHQLKVTATAKGRFDLIRLKGPKSFLKKGLLTTEV